METWKQIDGFSKYEVSTLGNVRNKETCNFMKQRIDWCGYNLVTLRSDNKEKKSLRVHRLVAKTFIPNPNGLPAVDHINHNKNDNTISNLQWMSTLENCSKNGNPNSRVIEAGIFYTPYQKNNKYGGYMVKTRSAEDGYSIIAKFRTLEQAREFRKLNNLNKGIDIKK